MAAKKRAAPSSTPRRPAATRRPQKSPGRPATSIPPVPHEPGTPVGVGVPVLEGLQALVRAVEHLVRQWPSGASADLTGVSEELRRARKTLGLAVQGELSPEGRRAHAAQRADPANSPHFGG